MNNKNEMEYTPGDFLSGQNPPVERDVQHRIYTAVVHYPDEPRRRILSHIVEYHPVIRFSR